MLIGLGVSALAAGLSLSLSRRSRPVSPARAPLASAAETAAPEASAVTLSRLGQIDITMTVDDEKRRMPVEFPEAKPDMHRIDYVFAISHPTLKEGSVFWEWGCSCLLGVNLSFKDYPTEKRAPEKFVPCISELLGPPTQSNPPFSYDWDAKGELPQLSVSTGISLRLAHYPTARHTAQQGWQRALAEVDRCARMLASTSR